MVYATGEYKCTEEGITEEGITGVEGGEMPTIRIAETYDLATTPNKLGLIGIHTPSADLIYKLYPGLYLNYKYVHVDSCDMAVACASVQPADPLQIGTEAGSIAPQDMFNPLLYRAVSNDAYNTVINRVYSTDYTTLNPGGPGSVDGPGTVGNAPFGSTNTIDHYYGLLGDSGWKKAMPQSGFAMTNLRPLVYTMVSNFGNTSSANYLSAADIDSIGATGSNGVYASTQNRTPIFRGSVQPMPRIPTILGQFNPTFGTDGRISSISTPPIASIPKTFVAVLVTPPAKQHVLYYRLRVVWTVTFTEPVSIVERGNLPTIQNVGVGTYTDYTGTVSAKSLEEVNSTTDSEQVTTEMVDTVDVSADLIMQR